MREQKDEKTLHISLADIKIEFETNVFFFPESLLNKLK